MEAHSSDVNYSTTSSLRSPAASLRDWTSKPGKLHWRDLNLETSECNKLSHWAIFTIMLILIIWSFIWINNFFIWCFFLFSRATTSKSTANTVFFKLPASSSEKERFVWKSFCYYVSKISFVLFIIYAHIIIYT